jgi:tetratricopeptide (TPR) repeat protein
LSARAVETSLVIPTYTRHPARRLPMLFSPGWESLHPETRDDLLGGPRRPVRYRAMVLENRHLRLTILPELGAKLWSVWDKNARAEVLHVPDVIKPGLISRPGAWIPGGMEFNFPTGHHVAGMRPVPCELVESGPAAAAVRSEFRDARTGMRMTVEIRLGAGEARFTIAYRLSNPTALAHRWYQWTNVGMTCHDRWRFLSKAGLYFTGGIIRRYPVNEDGVDISWYRNRDVATDSFMIGHCEDFFGCYDFRRDGGLVHVAPWRELRGKKYFTWGRSHQSYDSRRVFSDDGRDYVEIQTGPFESQLDYEIMPAGGARSFQSTWFPVRRTGGLEWADRDLAFAVREGRPWLYPAVDCRAGVAVGARRFARSLRAGRPVSLPAEVHQGTKVSVRVNGRLGREFRFPLAGRQEPGARARVARKHLARIDWQPKTAAGALALARRMARADCHPEAIARYRQALKFDPLRHAARLELADSLWHTGDFAGGARELVRLLDTPLAGEARKALARRADAEAFFLGPVLAEPAGPARELARAERLAGCGGFEAAARAYRRFLAGRPRCWRGHYGLARYFWLARSDRRRAVRHAERALALRPGDRDLVIELAPLFLWARLPRRAAELILGAPRAVRDLSVGQKLLARAHFELGEFAESFAILSRRRLYNWEGETAHYDNHANCAAALAERELSAGRPERALRFAGAAGVYPPNLGLIWRRMGVALPGYWRGAALERLGRREEARRAWREALAAADREHEVDRRAYGRRSHEFATDELAWCYGMCAVRLGDRRTLRRALAALERLRRDRLHFGGKCSDYFDGVVAELRGDLARARRCFRRHVRKSPETRLARLHLAALAEGRRRGEPAGPDLGRRTK